MESEYKLIGNTMKKKCNGHSKSGLIKGNENPCVNMLSKTKQKKMWGNISTYHRHIFLKKWC